MDLISNLVTLRRMLSMLALLFVSGCDNYFQPTIPTICEQHPELCQGLNNDGWCRAEKADIVRHRYDHLNTENDQHIFDLLLMYETYEQCIEKATHIRHIKYRDKETERMEGYLTALEAIRELSRQTQNSSDPRLQYYHWSRHQNKTAKARFIAQSDTFETPDLLIKLASIQIKHDNAAARQSLYKALTSYTDFDSIDPEIFQSLITANLDDERIDSAYIWTQVYRSHSKVSDTLVVQPFPRLANNTNKKTLDDVAEAIIVSLKKGKFNVDGVGLWRIK